MLVVGVTCTLSSRSFFFLSVRLVYVPAKFNVSISFAVAFLQPFEPRRPFLSIGYRSSSSSSLSMSPRYRHCLFIISPPDPCSHPFSGYMAPLWILGLTLPSPSPSFVLFLGLVSRLHLFRHKLDF